MQYAPQIQQPSRTFVVPLLAALLGAAVATATFAIVNIEDEAVNVSLPQAVQSAPPSDAVAGQRNDGGPNEGTAAQAMQPPYTASPDYRSSYQPATPEAQGSTIEVNPSTGFPYAGGSDQGSSAARVASATPRYDGGPNEGASSSAMSSESSGPQPYGGMRP